MKFIWKAAVLFSFIYSSPPVIANIGEAAVDAAKIMVSLTKNSHSVHPVNIEKTGRSQHITEKLSKRKTAFLNIDDLVSKRHKPNAAIVSRDLEKIATVSLEHQSTIIKKRPFKHFTEDEKFFIQNELNAGVSVKDIGRKIDRNPKSIRNFKNNENKKMGVLPVVERKRFSEDEKKFIWEQIAAGKSYAEIANDLKISVGSIATVVFRQRRLQGHIPITENEKEIIVQKYLAGISFDEISNELKKTPGSISDFLKLEKSNNPARFEQPVL